MWRRVSWSARQTFTTDERTGIFGKLRKKRGSGGANLRKRDWPVSIGLATWRAGTCTPPSPMTPLVLALQQETVAATRSRHRLRRASVTLRGGIGAWRIDWDGRYVLRPHSNRPRPAGRTSTAWFQWVGATCLALWSRPKSGFGSEATSDLIAWTARVAVPSRGTYSSTSRRQAATSLYSVRSMAKRVLANDS